MCVCMVFTVCESIVEEIRVRDYKTFKLLQSKMTPFEQTLN